MPATKERIDAQLSQMVAQLYDGLVLTEFAQMPERPHAEGHLHDLHLPYADTSVVEAACKSFREHRVTRVVISEEMDMGSWSPFPEVVHADTEVEFIMTGKVLELILDISGAKSIEILPNNHGDRPRKTVVRNLGNADAIRTATNALEFYRDSLNKMRRYVTRRKATAVRYGGLWATHGDKFSCKQGNALEEIRKRLGALAGAGGFSYDKTQGVAAAHEHRCYEIEAEGWPGILYLLPPCCLFPFYSARSKPGSYTRHTQWTGWFIPVYDREGNLVFPDTRMFRYKPAQWPRLGGGQ